MAHKARQPLWSRAAFPSSPRRGRAEVNPAAGSISFKSPLGTALMKRKVGDVVPVRRPAGEVELQICSVSYD